MQTLQESPRARQRAECIQHESRLANLEYQCEFLRGKWYEAITALADRGGRNDKTLARNVKGWAAAIRVLEERALHEAQHIHRLTTDDGESHSENDLDSSQEAHPPSQDVRYSKCS